MNVDLPSSSGLLFFFAKGAVLMGLMLTDVSKSFGSFQAIKDLSLEVREGALFGFLGATARPPNACI
jgi:ABC-type uncharacterized transport system ATPase subunit